MLPDAVLPALVDLLPVLSFLAALLYLDSYKLVRLGFVIAVVGCGVAVAGASYLVNDQLLGHVEIDFKVFTRYVSPILEELLKGLILFVLVTAKIPAWAVTSLVAIVAIGIGLFVFAFLSASEHRTSRLDGLGTVRRLVTMARHGLGIMHRPVPAAGAISFQFGGWLCQLFAVYTAMRAFGIHEALPAAGLVLLVMNVVTIVPLWPGNVGALQAAIAVPLKSYGVAYSTGVAFGFGLQAIEASVGVGVGLLFLAREGLSVAMLRVMPRASQAEVPGGEPAEPGDEETDAPRARARVPG